nr:hypothetical protein [Tanacetum cinerariifolium]
MDEALVPHARKLRIERINFRLLSDISSKEYTLQLVYDVLRLTPFFKAFLVIADVLEIYRQEFWATATVHHHSIRFKMDNKKHIVNLESFREMLHICPRLPVAIGATPPKTKASVWKTRSSFDTTVTPPTAAAGPRLSAFLKGKQPATTSKAKNEGTGTILGVPNVPTDESEKEISWKSTDEEGDDDDDDEGNDGDDDEGNDEDDQEEGSDDEQASDEEEFIHPSLSTHDEEETRDEESFDPISKTPKNTYDEGNGEENLGMNVGREEGQDEKDEEDELYRDVNINLGRGVKMVAVHTTQEFRDSYVTLTLVNLDGQQQSSSVSS